MKIAEFLKFAQSHLSDGLATIVGSGLSAAEGIPGMTPLAKHLKTVIPGAALSLTEKSQWEKVSKELDGGKDLESAMSTSAISEDLEAKIINTTAEYVGSAEKVVFREVVEKGRQLRISRLIGAIPKVNSGIPFITTNYDRIIEFAAESVGLGVDSLFSGAYVSSLNPEMSRMNFCKQVTQKGKQFRYHYKERVTVLKPHGSLDWYLRGTEPIRCSYDLGLPKLIITPGLNKYKNGYNRPFDIHREKANQAIDKATKLLVLGYGFNDDHLETHLKAKIKSGAPSLVLTYSLSPNCKSLISDSPNLYAVERGASDNESNVHHKNGVYTYDKNFWDLDGFLREAFGV